MGMASNSKELVDVVRLTNVQTVKMQRCVIVESRVGAGTHDDPVRIIMEVYAPVMNEERFVRIARYDPMRSDSLVGMNE